MSLFREMLKRIEFGRMVEGLELPEQGSNRGYSPGQLVTGFLASVWCEANCFEHL